MLVNNLSNYSAYAKNSGGSTPVPNHNINTEPAKQVVATGFSAPAKEAAPTTSFSDYSLILKEMTENARNGDRVDKKKDEDDSAQKVEQFKRHVSNGTEQQIAGLHSQGNNTSNGFDFDPSRVDEYLAKMKAPETLGEAKQAEGLSDDELQEAKDDQLQEMQLEQMSAQSATEPSNEAEQLVEQIQQSRNWQSMSANLFNA